MCLKNVENQKYLINSTNDHYDLTYTREIPNLGLLKIQPDFMSLPFLIYEKWSHEKVLTSLASLGQTILLIMLIVAFT